MINFDPKVHVITAVVISCVAFAFGIAAFSLSLIAMVR